MAPRDDIDRREFLASAAAGMALTIVPRHVLGGPGHTAPSDKLTLAYIGCGTQGIREMLRLLPLPDVQITAVCDPVKDGTNYVDWDRTGIRDSVRELLQLPGWGEGVAGIRAGRDMAKEIIETCYAKQRESGSFKSVASYADYRELLEKEKDLDSVKIMTPDHLHATISIAAMKKRKHVAVHKPLANRVAEVRMVVEAARRSGVATHLLAWRRPITAVQEMILDGAIGTLREVHNWTDRPFWPQALALPTDRPPVPPGFDWSLWLGPERDRPYHPSYTHALFRGWYDFGGGSVADMGNYSLWPIFMALDLPVPHSVEAQSSSSAEVNDQVSTVNVNDFAFPYANRVCFKFAAHGRWPAHQAVLVRRGDATLHARRPAGGRPVDPRDGDPLRRRRRIDPERGAGPGEEDAGLSDGEGPSGASDGRESPRRRRPPSRVDRGVQGRAGNGGQLPECRQLLRSHCPGRRGDPVQPEGVPRGRVRAGVAVEPGDDGVHQRSRGQPVHPARVSRRMDAHERGVT